MRISHHKLIIPLVLRNVDPHGLPEYLTKPNWIFFNEADGFDTALEDVIEALETDLDWRDAHTRLTVRTEEWLQLRGATAASSCAGPTSGPPRTG